jgi:hypothetical protein
LKPWLAICLALTSACLTREEIGSAISDAGHDAGCTDPDATPDLCRVSAMENMLRDLTDGSWSGTISWGGEQTTPETSAPIAFSFRLDGTYEAQVECGQKDVTVCPGLFLGAKNGHVAGRYTVSDVIQDQFYGEFLDPGPYGTVRSELRGLSLRGDRLEFDRRAVSWADLSFVTARVVLHRLR